MNDERAAGVSSVLRRRIAVALDAGERPSLQGNNLRLGSVVIQNANGSDRPAMQEVQIQMRRRGIDPQGAFDTFTSAPTRRGRSTYATDNNGIEKRIATNRGDQNRVTRDGMRFYAQSYTRWIVHIPTILRRISTGKTFQTTRHDRTGEELGLTTELQARGSEDEQKRVVTTAVERYLQDSVAGWNGALDVYMGDDDIEVLYDDSRSIEYSVQTSGIRDGGLTVDTILDRVVFGTPIFPEDMWQLAQLHESSRRRSGECGIDVIVASANKRYNNTRKPMLTAKSAAEALIELAIELDPDGALAKTAFTEVVSTEEVAGIDNALKDYKPDKSKLTPFVDGMRAFLNKPCTIDGLMLAIERRHIWRRKYNLPIKFVEAVREVFTWTKTPRIRLVLFLRLFDFHVDGENVMLRAPSHADEAIQAIRTCGTKVSLLVAFYERLDVKLVLINGSRFVRTWVPMDWDSRERDDKVSVVLNVWSHHVSAYKPQVGDQVIDTVVPKWVESELLTQRDDLDEHKYDAMEELDWLKIIEAIHARTAQSGLLDMRP